MRDSPPVPSIWLGYDPREAVAFSIAKCSARRFDRYIPVRGLVLDRLRELGLYYRPMWRDGVQLWDGISGAPMSTEFSISRFLVPFIAKAGWALYADCDVLFRRNPSELFDLTESDKAVMVVKHDYAQAAGVKMDGQIQTVYPRKNWSSVMLFNCDHPANDILNAEYVNTRTGRDLHGFCWLRDEEIGELPQEWNYLVGHSKPNGKKPALVHFTEGIPDMPGYEDQEFADEWRELKPIAVGAL